MFKVKRIDNNKIYQVLSVYADEVTGATWFFMWDNDGWRWRAASNYCPPNYETEHGGLV